MRNRNGKLPFNKTSFYRIARKRYIAKLLMTTSMIEKGLLRIKMLQSQNTDNKVVKVIAIANEAISTSRNIEKAMGNVV